MLIKLNELVDKYSIQFTGILHVGAHECEEIHDYDRYLPRNKVLWVEGLYDKVELSRKLFPNIFIIQGVVSDKVEMVKFNRSNNGQSSSILELGTHKYHHPHISYVDSYNVKSVVLKDFIHNYDISYNFINLDLQGAELKALKGMEPYLNTIDYIYTEVNSQYVYEGCALVTELDDYLLQFGFNRVETAWCENFGWGDAFYIKKTN